MTTMPRPIYETKEDKDIDLAHLFDTFINNRMLILGITGFFAAWASPMRCSQHRSISPAR